MANDAVKSQGNVTLTFGGNDLTCWLNSTDLQATAESLDSTTFCSTGAEAIADSTTWAINFNGLWDSVIDGYIFPHLISPGSKEPAVLTATDAQGVAVSYTWDPVAAPTNTMYGMMGSGNITSAVNALIGTGGAINLSGAPVRAVA